MASSLLGLSAIAIEFGKPEAGARLLGAAEGFAIRIGTTLFTRDDPVLERVRTALHSALGEERLTATRDAGRAMSIEAAITEAQAVARLVMSSR